MRMRGKHKQYISVAVCDAINIFLEEFMKRCNWVWIVMLTLIAVGLLAGCTKKQQGASGGPEPVELSVAWWGGDARHKKTLDMIDKYIEANPNVKVGSQYAAYTDYWTRMATRGRYA